MSAHVQTILTLSILIIVLTAIALLPAQPVGRWLRQFIVRIFICLVAGVNGSGIGLCADINRVTNPDCPEDAEFFYWTPIGFVVGFLIVPVAVALLPARLTGRWLRLH